VAAEPEYTAMDGFVLDGQRAIVANWVGAEGIWSVDLTTSRSSLRAYADAHSYETEHSAIKGHTPVARLHALANYLDVDWARLTRRWAQLSEYGLAGIAKPRSRLLDLRGVDRACRYLGDLHQHGDYASHRPVPRARRTHCA
jgi:hypothetical protein